MGMVRKNGVVKKAIMVNGLERANMLPIGGSARLENQVQIKDRSAEGLIETVNICVIGNKKILNHPFLYQSVPLL